MCVEGILRFFTNFYLQRKVSIFLRNDHYCKVVDPYNARKRYTVIENLDLMRIYLGYRVVSVKLRNPIRIVLRNCVQEIIVRLPVFVF